MFYEEKGNVHKDFHLATNTTIAHVLKTYGQEFLRELFHRTAQGVFRKIYESLKSGDYTPLLEFWKYYYDREGGVYEIEKKDDGIIFHVLKCPAAAHLMKRGTPVTDDFYLQTIYLNEGWSEGTPFRIETVVHGEGKYDQIIRRRNDAAE